ncbi:Nramp family divalent metal transporter [Rugosimonospora acidiphila]|uniref:Nramp family divalent metal transporter n=1 Tax=Rugosimonospora acidiphila TaxID=556531 RepID=A0ABP9RRQ6_9ACTN
MSVPDGNPPTEGERDRGRAGYSGSAEIVEHDGRPSRRAMFKLIGPGLVSGAAATDPTTVATLVVVGATTTYGLAWLTLLTFPVLAVVQTLATRVGFLARRDLQQVVTDRYGRWPTLLLLVSILSVDVVTVAADLEGGAAALGLLTGAGWRWFVAPLAAVLLALMFINGYDEIQRVLKYVLLCLLAYGVAALLAHPHWGAVGRGTLVPHLRSGPHYVAGALAILGTTVTAYTYLWQTLQQVEQPAARPWLRMRQVDAVSGTVLAVAVFWFILVASGATLGVGHEHVTSAETAAAALRPVAGEFASALFGIGLLASAVIAVPVITASAAYAVAAVFEWPRGLSSKPGRASSFYAVLGGVMAAGVGLGLAGINPIELLFTASLVAGVATPVGLVLLVMVAGDASLLGGVRTARWLLGAGWAVAVLVAALAVAFLAQQAKLID